MYELDPIATGNYIRKYRKLKNLSLEYIGSKIGKTKATLSQYEKGNIIPDFLTILEICNVLDLDLNDIFPSTMESKNSSSFPFNSSKVYLYYIHGKRIINLQLEFEFNHFHQKAILYTDLKNTKSPYFYEGSFEYSENIMYINLKNINSRKFEIEKVQIIVNFPLVNSVPYYNCFITGLTPSLLPTIKKGLITMEPLSNKDELVEKIKLSKAEIKQISSDNSWTLDNKIYDNLLLF